jgi:hypothetical protein
MLMEKDGPCGITLVTPRRKVGRRMTVAALAGAYRQTDLDGRLDLDRTVETLRNAKALMEAALRWVLGQTPAADGASFAEGG